MNYTITKENLTTLMNALGELTFKQSNPMINFLTEKFVETEDGFIIEETAIQSFINAVVDLKYREAAPLMTFMDRALEEVEEVEEDLL